jgi:hypothetical protein
MHTRRRGSLALQMLVAGCCQNNNTCTVTYLTLSRHYQERQALDFRRLAAFSGEAQGSGFRNRNGVIQNRVKQGMAARPSMLEKGELSRHSPDTARTEFAAPAGTTLRTKCPPGSGRQNREAGWRFSPHPQVLRRRSYGSFEEAALNELVAQLVEQRPFKAWVLGSSPSELTTPSGRNVPNTPHSLRASGMRQRRTGRRRTCRSRHQCCAALFAHPRKKSPVALRLLTVAGSIPSGAKARPLF